MDNLKLISVRLRPEDLAEIEKFLKIHPYWKRNFVICSILHSVLTDFDETAIYDMVRKGWFPNENVTATYRINKVPSPQGTGEK